MSYLAIKCGVILLFYSLPFPVWSSEVSDSLRMKSYPYLINKVDATSSNQHSLNYAEAWIYKAKKERNLEQLSAAYTAMMHLVPQTIKLQYCDSIINVAKRSGDFTLIGSALISRGIIYYKKRQYKPALNDYLKADALLVGTTDTYLKFKVTFVIAQLKYHLGYYEESRAQFEKCNVYFRNRDTIPYLRSLHGLAMSLNNLQRYNEASQINKVGLAMAYVVEDRAVVPYLTQSDGITAYGQKQYKQAVTQLRMALPALSDAHDYASEGITWLYLGKSLLALKQNDSAIVCFTNIDRIFKDYHYISPPLREGYELLIQHYDSKGDEKKALHYFRQLQAADKIFAKDYRHLYDKITGEYNPSALKREIAEIEVKYKNEQLINRLGYGLIGILLFSAVCAVRKFKKLREKPVAKVESEKQTAARIVSKLTQAYIDKVLYSLNKFEKNFKFRQSKLSLRDLAKELKSNDKYVAAIIIHYKGCSPSIYLNNLRINYIIDRLTTQPQYRKYSVKELGKEAGFATTNHFSNEFRDRMGELPSNYIKSLP